jgi:hypothetical protein
MPLISRPCHPVWDDLGNESHYAHWWRIGRGRWHVEAGKWGLDVQLGRFALTLHYCPATGPSTCGAPWERLGPDDD